MIIGTTTNYASRAYAARQFAQFTNEIADASQRLATGDALANVSHDPAGLIASERLRGAREVLDAEAATLRRTDFVANVADGHLGDLSEILRRTNALHIRRESALSKQERDAYDLEIASGLDAIDRISRVASHDGRSLFDGTVTLAAGQAGVNLERIDTASLGQIEEDGRTYSLQDLRFGGVLADSPSVARKVLSAAEERVATLRGHLGTFQRNSLQTRLNAIEVARENISAADASIRDVDVAMEVAHLARTTTLQVAAGAAIKKQQASLLDVWA